MLRVVIIAMLCGPAILTPVERKIMFGNPLYDYKDPEKRAIIKEMKKPEQEIENPPEREYEPVYPVDKPVKEDKIPADERKIKEKIKEALREIDKPEIPGKDVILYRRNTPVISQQEAEELVMSGVKAPITGDRLETETLLAHDYFRRLEFASNIWKSEWDEDLGELAQALANKCVFKHTNLAFDNGTAIGQNLAAISGYSKDQPFSLFEIVKYFYDEKKDYNYDTNTGTPGKVIGHYRQVVSYDGVKVACVRHYCETLYIENQAPWANTWYYVCDYFPPYKPNDRPYRKGNHCTNCVVKKGDTTKGTKCVENECQECVLAEDTECEKPPPCPDTLKDDAGAMFCGMYNNQYKCCSEQASKSMRDFCNVMCQKTCDVCPSGKRV